MTTLTDAYRNQHVLITGGVGFIGANLARRLLDLGANITLVDSLIPEYGGNLFNIHDVQDRVTVNISDVRDQYSMRYLVQGQDYVFNLAGQTSHMDSMDDPQTDLEINAAAQLSLLEACRQYNPEVKIVFASTRQIYGKPDYLPVDENHLLRPTDVNGINKMAGEWYHILYNNVYQLRSCALRLTNTYGPYMRVKDARQTFLGIWIRLLVEGQPFEVWGGEQLRDFNYVDDVVEAFLIAGLMEEANGRTMNLGSSEIVSLRELAELLVALHSQGEYVIREFPPERKKIDIGDYYSSFSLAARILNWEPRVSLKEGLQKTIAFYRQNLEHYR